MYPFLPFLLSIGTAYLAGRLAQRGPFNLADLAIGMFSGTLSLGLVYLLGSEHIEVGPALPLLLACALPLGLGSLRRYEPQSEDEYESQLSTIGFDGY